MPPTLEPGAVSDLFNRIQQALEGRYEIEREIGRGGMGIVYLAADVKLSRQVAIKVLRPELAQAVGAERFLREVRIEASFDHPNIVALYDSGEADGLPFYVMPYVKGESLRALIEREERLSLDEVVRIMNAVAAGLAHAHANGVIHRDIKPENILLTDDRVLVADFGIAKATAEAGGEKLSTYGLVLGTPEYMSPEQAMGDKVDARTDIYAFGCVVYEMLSGDPPFGGRTRSAIVAKHVQEKVPSLRIVRKNVPHGAAKAVEKALEKVPSDRFAAAQDFAEAVEKGIRRPDEPPTPVGLRVVAAALIGVLALLVARLVWPPPAFPLDARRVLNLPMRESGFRLLSAGIGKRAALAVGTALEQTDPLRFEWGERWLSPEELADVGTVVASKADSIARARRARYRVDGEIVEEASSASVILWLYDVAGDSLVIQHTERGLAHDDSIIQLALRGAAALVPHVLLEPGRELNLVDFTSHDPGAVVFSTFGEEAYRSSRFESAFDYYTRAVARDSTMTMAALKGAQAASWLKEYEDAEVLVDRALARAPELPERHSYFARGLKGYLTGMADTAVHWLESALEDDPGWTEAHYALGEVYYHLLPSRARLDSLAEASFAAAVRSDSAFTPPLYHMTQLALRRHDVAQAETLLDRFRAFEPESRFVPALELALQCVRDGPDESAINVRIEENAYAVYQAGHSLVTGISHGECAEVAFRMLLASDSSRYHWGAFMSLQGLFAAQGRDSALVALVDSAIDAGQLGAMPLYLIDAIAGANVDSQALRAEEYGSRWGEEYERFETFAEEYLWVGWLYGAWHAYRGDKTGLAVLHRILSERAERSDRAELRMFAEALGAHLHLLEGDTASAISSLRSLTSVGSVDELSADYALSMPVERLRLAELLCARRAYRECFQEASVFDHQGPLVFLPFVPRSLTLRLEAAVGLGEHELANYYRGRISRLRSVH